MESCPTRDDHIVLGKLRVILLLLFLFLLFHDVPTWMMMMLLMLTVSLSMGGMMMSTNHLDGPLKVFTVERMDVRGIGYR